MALFSFKLHDLRNIQLYDSIPWFHLSDCHYWMELGDIRLFESTENHPAVVDDDIGRYVNYYLARLMEDLQYILEVVAEPVPDDLYQRIKNVDSLAAYYTYVCRYRENIYQQLEGQTDEAVDKVYDRYDQLTEWLNKRSLPTTHLAYGPDIFFIRNKDTMIIIWDATQRNEEGALIWTAGAGQYEMPYQLFITEVESFRDRILFAMGAHIADVNEMDVMVSDIDKHKRIEENKERFAKFNEYLAFLRTNKELTDWDAIREVISEAYKYL